MRLRAALTLRGMTSAQRSPSARADPGVGDAGVAARRVDERPPRPEAPVLERRLDHPERRPILHRAARVHELALRVDADARQLRADAAEAHERRLPDEPRDRLDRRGAGAGARVIAPPPGGNHSAIEK